MQISQENTPAAEIQQLLHCSQSAKQTPAMIFYLLTGGTIMFVTPGSTAPDSPAGLGCRFLPGFSLAVRRGLNHKLETHAEAFSDKLSMNQTVPPVHTAPPERAAASVFPCRGQRAARTSLKQTSQERWLQKCQGRLHIVLDLPLLKRSGKLGLPRQAASNHSSLEYTPKFDTVQL